MTVRTARAWPEENGSDAPIFVLAPPLSFGSLLCAALGQHPQLYGVADLNLLQATDMREYWSGQAENVQSRPLVARLFLHDGLLRTVAQLYAGEQTFDGIEMAKRWVRVRLARTTVDVHGELRRKISPLRMVESSSAYVTKARFLERLCTAFPKARFIHVLRHPRSHGEALMQKAAFPLWAFFQNAIDRRTSVPLVDPQILWHDINVRILDVLDRLASDRYYRIRGETFLSENANTLRRLCKWLGLSTSGRAIRAMMQLEASPFSRIGPVNARHGCDADFLERPSFDWHVACPAKLDGPLSWRPDGATFHPRVSTLARAFGYE